MKRCAATALGFLVAIFALTATADCDMADPDCVSFFPLGSLAGGATQSTVAGLSWDGLVAVGTSISGSSTPRGEGFRWSQVDGMAGLGSLPGGSFQSQATSIHKTASHFWIGGGASSNSTGAKMEAAVYFSGDGAWQALGSLPDGSNQSMVYALDSLGEMEVGSSTSLVSGPSEQQAAYREGTTWEALEIPSNAVPRGEAYGVDAQGTAIVGRTATSLSSSNKREAARWTTNGVDYDVEILRFPAGGAAEGQARAIDANGEFIVGQARNPQNLPEAFRWSQNQMSGLGDLEGGPFDSEALAVATGGRVVVGRGTVAAGSRAFLWTPEEGIRPLRDVFEEVSGTDLGAWKLEEATAISRDGRVVAGNGRNPQNLPEAWVLTLPEPETFAPRLAALGVLAGLARSRRSRIQPESGSAPCMAGAPSICSRTQPSGPRSNS